LHPPGNTRRYGIAHQAMILVGKVLSDQGSGQTGWILQGINWAVANRATVISMSLGSRVAVGQTFSPAYEQAAQAALNAQSLIVAAAGNEGNSPVGSPANCPSVMAVAAVGNNLQRAPFSCIGINPNGGEVNIAGPGVNVFSTVPMAIRYGMKSGTSMATPHVAGIAALWAQNSGLRGMALWKKLISTALNIGQTPQQVGSGLVQAPRCLPILPPVPHPVPLPQPIPIPDPGPIHGLLPTPAEG
jgi:subtilisin family serine protease